MNEHDENETVPKSSLCFVPLLTNSIRIYILSFSLVFFSVHAADLVQCFFSGSPLVWLLLYQ